MSHDFIFERDASAEYFGHTRFVQSIRQECLDHFIIFGTQHLDVLCREYLAHYHTARPHQGLDDQLIVKATGSRHTASEEDIPPLSAIRCRTRLLLG